MICSLITSESRLLSFVRSPESYHQKVFNPDGISLSGFFVFQNSQADCIAIDIFDDITVIARSAATKRS